MRGEARAKWTAGPPPPVSEAVPPRLPTSFTDWFDRRGWQPRPHQLGLLANVAQRRSTLLIAPTGAGKTLAGFLPSLRGAGAARSRHRAGQAVHTLYVLAAEGAGGRRGAQPAGARAADGSADPRRDAHRRHVRSPQGAPAPAAARHALDHARAGRAAAVASDAAALLRRSRYRHPRRAACADAPPSAATCWRSTWRGLQRIAPGQVRIGLSATVARPSELRAYLVPQTDAEAATRLARPRHGRGRRTARYPHARNGSAAAVGRAYHPLCRARNLTRPSRRTDLSLLFVNTRSQAELLFQELWRMNEHNLPIALHHGSLDAARRRKVEAAMAPVALQRGGVRPPRSISASTGATSTSSSMWERRRARAA